MSAMEATTTCIAGESPRHAGWDRRFSWSDGMPVGHCDVGPPAMVTPDESGECGGRIAQRPIVFSRGGGSDDWSQNMNRYDTHKHRNGCTRTGNDLQGAYVADS